MMKNKTFNLTLTEEQLDLVWNALDEYREFAAFLDEENGDEKESVTLFEVINILRDSCKE